jgi:UDP-N-acetylmuramate dehydrogenase
MALELVDRLEKFKVELKAQLGSIVVFDLNIGAKTTYRVGGNAMVSTTFSSVGQLEVISGLVSEFDIPVLILGAGSNLLISDRGFVGLCIVGDDTLKDLRTEKIDDDTVLVTATGPMALPTVARQLAKEGISGFEWAVGIPGTVGGSIKTNAGGHGSQTSNTLLKVEMFDFKKNKLLSKTEEQLELKYRSSNLRDDQIVMNATHRLSYADPIVLKNNIDQIVKWRRENQPGGQNAGSVFVNPKEISAGQLIDQLNLKSYRIRTAQVSPKHGNFIQADKNGSADDVYELICHIKKIVAERTGIELQTELKLIGFNR